MKYALWTKEQAEQAASEYANRLRCPPSMDPGGVQDTAEHVFLEALAWAAEMIEACPTVYGSYIGDPINRYWENIRGSCDTHTAKLVGVRPIKEGE